MKRALSLLLALLLCLSFSVAVFAEDGDAEGEPASCGEEAVWEFDADSGTLSVYGDGAMDDYESSAAAPWASYAQQITALELGGELTHVGDHAFADLPALTEISMSLNSELVSLGKGAFQNDAALKRYLVSEELAVIGEDCFKGCTGMTVNMDDSRDSIFWTSLREIGPHAFENTAVTMLRLNVVETIGEGAFSGCSALEKAYYVGRAQEWENVTVGSGNGPLLDALQLLTDVGYPATCEEDGLGSVLGYEDGDPNLFQISKNGLWSLVAKPEILEATGHDWGEWKVTTPATAEAEGVETRVCNNDPAHTETRSIARLEPTPTPEPTASPTPTPEPTASPTPTPEPTASPTPTPEPTPEPEEVVSRVEAAPLEPTAALAAVGFDTVEAIEEELMTVVEAEGFVSENAVSYDVTLMVSADGGRTWVPATAENFPEEGLGIVLEYPEGIDAANNDFLVAHMFGEDMGGHKAGEVELLTPRKTEKGLAVTVTGLSPFAITWKESAPEEAPETPFATSVPTDAPAGNGAAPGKERAPRTGDEAPIALWAAAFALCAMGTAALTRKRREE